MAKPRPPAPAKSPIKAAIDAVAGQDAVIGIQLQMFQRVVAFKLTDTVRVTVPADSKSGPHAMFFDAASGVWRAFFLPAGSSWQLLPIGGAPVPPRLWRPGEIQ